MKDIVIVGAGGLSREVAFLLGEINRAEPQWNLLGHIDADAAKAGTPVGRSSVIGGDDWFDGHGGELYVVIAVGTPQIIRRIATRLRERKNFRFPNLVHPSVVRDRDRVSFGDGNMVFGGAMFTTDIDVGSFNVVNPACTIGHDTHIGSYNVINPGCIISGGVVVGDACLLGAGATILQYKTIGDDAIVGAGAVVTKPVPAGVTVVGSPAKPLEKKTS